MQQPVNMRLLLHPPQTLIQSNIQNFKGSTNATSTVPPFPYFATFHREALDIVSSNHLSLVPGHRRFLTNQQHSVVLLVTPKLRLSSMGPKNHPNKKYRLRLRQIILPLCLSTFLRPPDIIAAPQLHQRKATRAVASDV